MPTCMTYGDHWAFEARLHRVRTFEDTVRRDIEVLDAHRKIVAGWAWHIVVDAAVGDDIMGFCARLRHVLSSLADDEESMAGSPLTREGVEAKQTVLSAKIAMNSRHIEVVGGVLKESVEAFWELLVDKRHIMKFDESLDMREDVGLVMRQLREEVRYHLLHAAQWLCTVKCF